MIKSLFAALVLGLALAFIAAPACQKKTGDTIEDIEQARLNSEAAADAAATEAAAKPVPPPPKIDDNVYAEIRARSALLYDKYKEDMDTAQKFVDELYDKFQITLQEFKAFESRQTPPHRGELEKKVMDFLQKFANDYR